MVALMPETGTVALRCCQEDVLLCFVGRQHCGVDGSDRFLVVVQEGVMSSSAFTAGARVAALCRVTRSEAIKTYFKYLCFVVAIAGVELDELLARPEWMVALARWAACCLLDGCRQERPGIADARGLLSSAATGASIACVAAACHARGARGRR